MSVAAIQERYAGLAESTCCLSCGTAAGRAEVLPGQVCVDLGSGRGEDVLRLAARVGPGGHAYGIDATDAMIDRARQGAARLGVGNATFLKGTLEALPLPDDTADWVVSNCVLNHAADKGATWRDIRRVLKPGGRFLVSDIYAVDEIPAVYSGDPARVAECWAGAVPREVYLRQVAEAGLEDVRVVEEGVPRRKGEARVVSFTVSGRKPERVVPGRS